NLQNHGTIDLLNGLLNLTGVAKGSEIGSISGSGSQVIIVGTLDNRSNNLTLDPATGSWQLTGTLLGGTIQGPSGVALRISGARATLDGTTLNIDLVIDYGFDLRITNGLTLNKTITLEGGFNFTPALKFDGTQMFDGIGTVTFAGDYKGAIQPLNGALTIGPG